MKTPDYILKNRPNKIAKGMTRTIYRDGHGDRMSEDALRLSVRGTLDSLRGLQFYSRHIPCQHCGSQSRGKLALNDAGHRRLKSIRHLRRFRAIQQKIEEPWSNPEHIEL